MARPVLRILTPQIGAQEQVFALADAAVRIGRDESNDIVLLEQAASRHHARVEPTADGGYEVVDEGSAAGVTVGGEKVLRKVLVDGDEIKIGGTTVRFVAAAGSEPTFVPGASPPSSQATEAASDRPHPPAAPVFPPPPDPFGDADTMLPDPTSVAMPPTVASDHQPAPSASETVSAPHAPATPPSETVAAAHQPAPAPAPVLEPEPKLEVESPAPAPTPATPPPSNPSFVLGDGKSSPSNYTLDGGAASGASGGYSLDGDASPAPAKSGGYELEGKENDPLGGVVIHGDTPPTTLRSGPGAGTYVTFGLIGAALSFGALVALQGTPW